MSENKFEAAVRLLKAIRKAEDKHSERLDRETVRHIAEREAIFAEATPEVREMVLAEQLILAGKTWRHVA